MFFQLDEEHEDDEENLDDPETPEGISKTKPKTKESKPQTKETNVFEDSFINDGEDQSESDFDFEVCFFSFTYFTKLICYLWKAFKKLKA